MRAQVHHIARSAIALVVLVAAMATVITTAKADKSKRGIDRARSAVPTSAIRYATPTIGAYEVIMNALGRQPVAEPAKPVQKETTVQVLRDKTTEESRIEKAHATGDVFRATIVLSKDESRIDVGIYNMLGKRMMDVYVGQASRGTHEYSVSTTEMPEGVYICILQGGNVRRAAKFYLNR